MADTPTSTPSGAPQSWAPVQPITITTPPEVNLTPPLVPPPATNFLGDTPTVQKQQQENLYNDFFQDDVDGKLKVGKEKKSGLEVFVNVMKYVTIVVVTLGILFSLHVFMRTRENTSFIESYPFLCPYLNYDIDAPGIEKWCKSISTLKADYDTKFKKLKFDIVEKLTEYVPVKVGVSIQNNSPERVFAIKTYEQKPQVDQVIAAFEKIKKSSQYSGSENIECTTINVTEGYKLSTQCSVLGGPIGVANKGVVLSGSLASTLGIESARIMALRFLESIANTEKSSFVLENPPTSLTIEKLDRDEQLRTGFDTKTSVSIQARYVPITPKF